ncbi:hypothetical protein BGZ83_005124 [Gryganskiella cystojenkinii]|nr:hypothetical protein BGZ83_005124 [Gryganskiella cystojenkinii]
MPPSSSSSVSASASPAHSSSSLLFLGKDRSAIEGMTNNSVMSFVHPEDLRILCRGLDRVCKALYTQFRVRWRVHTSPIVTPQTESNETISACADFSASDEMLVSPKKTIEFQGEIFEEWIDPTGMEYFTACKNVISAKDSSDDEEEQALFAWTEIKGVISQGQPMLVIRPLTAQERIQMQLEEEASSAIESSRSRSYQDNDKENDGDETDEAYESAQEASWKIKSKRMGLEERMTLPKQLNLSALTTLSIEERSNRMPGSFPLTKSTPLHLLNNNNNSYSSSMYTQQQPSSSSFTRCYSSGTHSRTSSGWMTMPAAMAYPATVSPPWTVVMTVALDAWKKWIQTVHAGQAQFKDWCEYVLVLTFDQAIEGVSLGLTLLGVEGSQSSKAISRLSESEEVEEEDEGLGQDLVQHQQQHRRHLRAISSRLEDPSQETQPTMTGMDRVGKILEAYPSVDGVVKQIGGSWLGQMVKFRLEHKLERVAGQVVNWWDRSAPLRAAAAGTAHGNIQVTEIQHQ